MNEVESKVWIDLYNWIGNPYAVAGIMANLKAESAMNPGNLQNSFEKKLGMTDAQYVTAVDAGTYSRRDFINDGAGFGLAQWTYWSRKQMLYDYMKDKGLSISSLGGQMDFLKWEIEYGYVQVFKDLKACRSVREATEIVLKKYEKPADQSAAAVDRRTVYGDAYYKDGVENSIIPPPIMPDEPTYFDMSAIELLDQAAEFLLMAREKIK